METLIQMAENRSRGMKRLSCHLNRQQYADKKFRSAWLTCNCCWVTVWSKVTEVFTECWFGFLHANGFNSLVRLQAVTQVNWKQMRLLSGNRRDWEKRLFGNQICSQCTDSPEASRREILRATQQEYAFNWDLFLPLLEMNHSYLFLLFSV